MGGLGDPQSDTPRWILAASHVALANFERFIKAVDLHEVECVG